MTAKFSPSDLQAALRWRYATKSFDASKKIPSDIWQALEDALILAPSSYGLQPWKFFVVTDAVVREELRVASWNQSQAVDCSHFVVFTVRHGLDAEHIDRHLSRHADVRKVTAESLVGYRKLLVSSINKAAEEERLNVWQTHQAYIALGLFMAAAAVLKVDTCPMEGIDLQGFDSILKLTDGPYRTAVACAAGYRAESDKYGKLPKVRFDAADVVVHI